MPELIRFFLFFFLCSLTARGKFVSMSSRRRGAAVLRGQGSTLTLPIWVFPNAVFSCGLGETCTRVQPGSGDGRLGGSWPRCVRRVGAMATGATTTRRLLLLLAATVPSATGFSECIEQCVKTPAAQGHFECCTNPLISSFNKPSCAVGCYMAEVCLQPSLTASPRRLLPS